MTHRRWFRLALGFLALSPLQVGSWAVLAPQSFYDTFPGFGRTWVAVDGPYNEHLIRDVGALNLAFAVMLVWAAVSLSRQLVLASCVASLAWGVPHLLYHIVNTDGLSSSDIAISLTGLVVVASLPIMILVTARRRLPEG